MKLYAKTGFEWFQEHCVGLWVPALTGATGPRLYDSNLTTENHAQFNANLDRNTAWQGSPNGSVVSFNGTNQNAQLAQDVQLATNRFTLAIWANQNAAGIGMPVGNRATTNSYLWYRSGNYLRFQTPTAQAEFLGVTNFTGWNLAIFSGVQISTTLSRITLYWNGLRQTSIDTLSSTFTFNTIGDGYAAFAFAFPGRIAEVAAWRETISDGNAALLHRADIGGAWQLEPPRKRSYFAQVLTTTNRNRSSRYLCFPG